LKRFLWLLALLAAASAAHPADWPSPQRLAAHVRFLAHGLLEGRAPGTRGGRLAAEYLAAQFAVAGARPGAEDGTYFQKVPLAGVKVADGAVVRITGGRAEPLELTWGEDFVGLPGGDGSEVSLAAPLVFVSARGFGSGGAAAPSVAARIQGKVVVAFAGEPLQGDGSGPGGADRARPGWREKLAAARKAGAAGILLIHSEQALGYPWEAVRAAWDREVAVLREEASPDLRIAGWLSWKAAERMLARAGHSAQELWKTAERKPPALPLMLEVRGRISYTTRRFDSPNVVAAIPGSAPGRRGETVVFLAHWDHLGAQPGGDGYVYNGAVDNAAACAVLLELARLWSSLEKKPARTALFVAATAEEPGQAGTRWYLRHPVAPLEKTRLILSFDSLLPAGLPGSVVVAGPQEAGVWTQLRDAARRLRLKIEPGRQPGGELCGSPYLFARAGVPAFRVQPGETLAGRQGDSGAGAWQAFVRGHYHRPSDEVRDEWDYAGLARIVEFAFLAGRMAADLP